MYLARIRLSSSSLALSSLSSSLPSLLPSLLSLNLSLLPSFHQRLNSNSNSNSFHSIANSNSSSLLSRANSNSKLPIRHSIHSHLSSDSIPTRLPLLHAPVRFETVFSRSPAMPLPGTVLLGSIGGGQMAKAIVLGLVHSKAIADPRTVWVSDASEKQLEQLSAESVNTTTDNLAVVAHSNVIILAVKPHIIAPVLKQIASHIRPAEHLIISIAAGITIETLESLLPSGARVVRVMPNTPSLVGAGASGYCLGSNATPADNATVEAILETMGCSARVTERDLDGVTGLSGSGPAYVFLFIEALADGGVRAGLSREVAQKLAIQTVFGAASMLLQTKSHPGVLKDSVASPGGTTIAGIHALEQGTFRGTVMNAVYASAQRAAELGQTNTADKNSKL